MTSRPVRGCRWIRIWTLRREQVDDAPVHLSGHRKAIADAVRALTAYNARVDSIGFERAPDDYAQNLFLALKLSNAQMGTVDERAQISSFADSLDVAVQAVGFGEVDGHDIGDGLYVLSFHGSDVDRLMEELRPLFRRSQLCAGGHFVRMVKGDGGRWERRVVPI